MKTGETEEILLTRRGDYCCCRETAQVQTGNADKVNALHLALTVKPGTSFQLLR
jgi:hypothetical protein